MMALQYESKRSKIPCSWNLDIGGVPVPVVASTNQLFLYYNDDGTLDLFMEA